MKKLAALSLAALAISLFSGNSSSCITSSDEDTYGEHTRRDLARRSEFRRSDSSQSPQKYRSPSPKKKEGPKEDALEKRRAALRRARLLKKFTTLVWIPDDSETLINLPKDPNEIKGIAPSRLAQIVHHIEQCDPKELEKFWQHVTEAQLKTPYRERATVHGLIRAYLNDTRKGRKGLSRLRRSNLKLIAGSQEEVWWL